MGCTESVPQPTTFNNFQELGARHPTIGASAGADPSRTAPTEIIVKEKLFTWSGDDFQIKHTNGQLLGNGLKVKGKAFAFRDQMALVDGNGDMLAVCLRKFEFIGQTFKIYLPYPWLPNQAPSGQDYNGKPLYTYCQVTRVPMSTTQEIRFEDEVVCKMVIQRVGGLWPKQRLVKLCNGAPLALMKGGTWEGMGNGYLITICPGIDPCLIVCIAAICDEMDEDR